MKCLNPITLQTISPLYPRGLIVPCGKCLQCRIQKRREWSLRMLHELDVWDKAVFLTLTYNDQSLPYNGPYMLSGPGEKYQYKSPIGPVVDCWPSLCKEDLQKFWKRLRKIMVKILNIMPAANMVTIHRGRTTTLLSMASDSIKTTEIQLWHLGPIVIGIKRKLKIEPLDSSSPNQSSMSLSTSTKNTPETLQ